MIRYGAAIATAFRSLFKCWALWGLIVVGYLAMGLVALLAFGGLALSGFFTDLFELADPTLQMAVVFLGAMVVLGLTEMLLYYWIHAGAIHLSDRAIAGERVSFSEGLRAGIARWPALTGFELLLAMVIGAGYMIMALIFVLALGGFVTGADNIDDAFAAVFGVLFCAYGALFLLAFLLGAIVMGFEAVGARSAVLSGRGGVQAFGDAWSTVKTRLKNVFLMGLAVFGLSWAYSMAASIVLTPIQFAFMPRMMQLDQTITPDPAEIVSLVGGMYATIMTASIVVQIPLMVFLYLVWTAFYRQLVGLDVPEVAPVPQYGYAPAGEPSAVAPGAPSAPAAPAPPAAPAAPAPPAPPAPPHTGGLPAPPTPTAQDPTDSGE